MTNTALLEKFEILPDFMKSEASLFIDFLIFKSNQSVEYKQRIPGFLAGKISITDDFDEPLEEFKDYM
jgi:hypothetical protein